ncbi:MAG TPA: adenylate/guanylate cyclase domain-containing protein [Reyranella sp.]|nr:adenylate/guanylate cyclase domain-containing protein [Reyranella sp.]
MDIRAWLEQLGLGRYADAFAANHIDDDGILRGLTTEDLRELGVASLGHRKRLLDAIAHIVEPAQPLPDAHGPVDRNERRQVVVLFADICGFTELSAAVGAEEARRIVEGFLSCADAIIAEHGGTVDKHVGDATMALFGAPLAHGDDALRAVSAAVALQRAMPSLCAEIGRPVAAHVGVAMGDVVAGDIGSAVRRDYTVLGDTVNLASRLVGEAGAGETVLGDSVWQAVANRMAATDLGERPLKGIARPQRLWRLDGPRETVSAGRLPFIGRELELAQAVAVISAAGPGAVLHIRGEAGIGKSRLLSETLAEAERRGFAPILVRIVDFGADRRQSPLRALAEQLDRRAPHWRDGRMADPSERAALHDILDQEVPPGLAGPYFAMEDSRRAALRIQALAGLAAAVARSRPLAIAIEDLHWSDDAIRKLVRVLARHTLECPILLVTTSRIEGDPVDAAFRRDLGGASLAVVELGPLRTDAMQRLARAAASALDEAKATRLVARSGGNPLFLEQLVLNAGDAEAKPLPGTIRALVQARLDRLSQADRGALQAAGVLGQRFSLPALRALLRQPHFDVKPLVEAGLLAFDGDMVMFVHALIQEATYASLLGETARGLHRRAAEWLGDSEPDLRASHLDRAGDPAAAWAYRIAAEYFRWSGNLSLALERAERGLQLARDDAEMVALLLLVGHLKLELGSAREAEAHFRSVSAHGASGNARAEAEFGIAAALRIVDDMAGATGALDRALAAAEAQSLTELQSRCHHLRGNLLFPAGRVEECMKEHSAALALAERAQSPELTARALGGLADAFYAQGRMRSALDALERCIDAARQAGAGAIEIANLPMVGIAQCFMLRLDAMAEAGEMARTMARQAQNRRAELIALHVLMVAAVESDRPLEGLPHVERARQIVAELGAWRFEGENVIFGAQLEAACGRAKLAAEMAREAVALCREHALSYIGPAALGIGAALSDDPAERDAWLAEGDALLQRPTLGHNHLFFRRNAIEASMSAGRIDEARRHANALAEYCAHEPMPFTDLVVRRGVLLADAVDGILAPKRRAELSELHERARKAGFLRLSGAMLDALSRA